MYKITLTGQSLCNLQSTFVTSRQYAPRFLPHGVQSTCMQKLPTLSMVFESFTLGKHTPDYSTSDYSPPGLFNPTPRKIHSVHSLRQNLGLETLPSGQRKFDHIWERNPPFYSAVLACLPQASQKQT